MKRHIHCQLCTPTAATTSTSLHGSLALALCSSSQNQLLTQPLLQARSLSAAASCQVNACCPCCRHSRQRPSGYRCCCQLQRMQRRPPSHAELCYNGIISFELLHCLANNLLPELWVQVVPCCCHCCSQLSQPLGLCRHLEAVCWCATVPVLRQLWHGLMH
jgi:hypothetical protein